MDLTIYVVCGMEIGLLGRKSQQRRSDFPLLGELLGINDTWLRFRDQKEIESQDELDSMQYSGIYLLSQNS